MIKKAILLAVATVSINMLTACNGIFDDIYDQPKPVVPAKGQLVIDATSWTDWYYVSLPRLQRLAEAGDEDALLKAQTEFEKRPIPFALSEGREWDGRSGQYMYWFDVWGAGIQNNEFRELTRPTRSKTPRSGASPCIATTCARMAALSTRHNTHP